MAVFSGSFLDSIVDYVKKKYKIILLLVGLLTMGTLFVVYKNEQIHSNKEIFTNKLIELQELEGNSSATEQSLMNKLDELRPYQWNEKQKLLIDFYKNKILLRFRKPQDWTEEYISRVNIFKDMEYNDDYLSSILRSFSNHKMDNSFSILGEMSLIMKINGYFNSGKYEMANEMFMNYKGQGLPNHLLWFYYIKTQFYRNNEINGRLFLLQCLLYNSDNIPNEPFRTAFATFVVSLDSLR